MLSLLRIFIIAVPVLFVIGIVLALRGTSTYNSASDDALDKAALQHAFMKHGDSLEEIEDSTEFDTEPINFESDQLEDTMDSGSRDEKVDKLINAIIREEKMMTPQEIQNLRDSGNDVAGFEDYLTTPEIYEVDPFAPEATSTSLDLVTPVQLPESVTVATNLQSTERPVYAPRTSAERQRQQFVISVSNLLTLAGQKALSSDEAASILATLTNNATTIPEANTVVFENGTMLGDLKTASPNITASYLYNKLGFDQTLTEPAVTYSPFVNASQAANSAQDAYPFPQNQANYNSLNVDTVNSPQEDNNLMTASQINKEALNL